jgi:hypothetical protein
MASSRARPASERLTFSTCCRFMLLLCTVRGALLTQAPVPPWECAADDPTVPALDLPSIAASPKPSLPDVVLNCAAYINATSASVVRIPVPDAQSVIIPACRATAMWGVRVVVAVGRNSWVWLRGWDVQLGGVTIQSLSGAVLENATAIVDGASRIVTQSSSDTHPTSLDSDDVHSVSVVGPTSVRGFTLLVTEGSTVTASHRLDTILYATAATVRTPAATVFIATRITIVIASGSSVSAYSRRSTTASPYN